MSLSACTNRYTKYNRNIPKDLYKLQFISAYLTKYKNDTIWFDEIPCIIPSYLDKQAVREIDSLVNESFSKLWKRSDEGREFIGSREGLILNAECVTDELLSVLYSKNLDVLAKNFETRLKKK
jgi:hypothetical protein